MNLDTLSQKVKGTVIVPSDPAYNEARKVFNGMIDRSPAAILKCKDEQDVVTGVNFARENKILASVRGGGHNGNGFGVCDNGLVIDLSEMTEAVVDPVEKTVRIQGGATLGDIGNATHEHGLALPVGINSTTGLGGLTLGGGIGYLTRKGGLTIDNLLEARMVMANGDVVVTNSMENPDLFWAIRGGGGNFGVVVEFKFKLLEQKTVYAGPVFWSLDKAREVFTHFDRFYKNADYNFGGFLAFLMVPPGDPFPVELHNKRVCGAMLVYAGPIEEAEEALKPLTDFADPLFTMLGEMPPRDLNSMFDAIYPFGLQMYWKGNFVNDLTTDIIDVCEEYGRKLPSLQSTMHFYPVDGKAHEVSNEDTAWANRGTRYAQVIVGVDADPANAQTITDWTKQHSDAMQPFVANKGGYVNFLMEDSNDKVKASYGSNHQRLVEIKTKYDPDNFFQFNQNIKPKS